MQKLITYTLQLFLGLSLIAITNCTETSPTNPSDIVSNLDKWKIMLGNGTIVQKLDNFQNDKYFYTSKDSKWVVFKTPNSGTTSPNSNNTRTELHQLKEWTPTQGGKLNGTLKVKHVSTSGDARVAASYSVVVGQIHSAQGHKNEPIKIFYKKFPGHTKGSIFWNYEINTEGNNKRRWDFSTQVWGYDMSIVGDSPSTYPEEPDDGITLDEEFSYEINVYQGIMYLTFKSRGHPTKTFRKSLIESIYRTSGDIPIQIKKAFVRIGQDGTEKPNAYQGELQYFKQGAYNQTNGKDPESNIIWCTGSNVYGGDIIKQYDNGSYTEVWFKESKLSTGTAPYY